MKVHAVAVGGPLHGQLVEIDDNTSYLVRVGWIEPLRVEVQGGALRVVGADPEWIPACDLTAYRLEVVDGTRLLLDHSALGVDDASIVNALGLACRVSTAS